jgi:hypothetical protein
MSVQNPVPIEEIADRISKVGGLNAILTQKRFLMLFPILEYPFPLAKTICEEIFSSRHLVDEQDIPFEDVIVSALKEDSVYWVVLALKWIESGFPVTSRVKESILHASSNDSLDQSARHKAYRAFHRI